MFFKSLPSFALGQNTGFRNFSLNSSRFKILIFSSSSFAENMGQSPDFPLTKKNL